MRFLPRIPLYSAAAALATAGTMLLATTPVQAQGDWTLGTAPDNERATCVPVADGGVSLNQRPWAKNFIGLDQAQQFNRGTFDTGSKAGKPVVIAVIDSGVSAERADVFGSRLLEGHDWWDPDSKGQCDSKLHGTAVAAIAAGSEVGDGDFIGVAPEANILPIRVFTGDTKEGGDQLKSMLVALSINDAVAHGADVINVSSAMVHTPELQSAVENAIASNVVVVAATGNENKNMDDRRIEADQQTYYPANYPGVIAVGAHNPVGNWYAQTNFGMNIDLLAPGQDVAFPHAAGEWYSDQGTSYAAPFVAGAAALLKGEYGAEATPAWIQKRLQETAIHPPNSFNIYQGHGVLNVAAALTAPYDPNEVISDTVAEEPTDDASATPPIADENRPSIAGLDPEYDPLGFEKTVAWASVGGSIVLITLVLVLRKVIPEGRRRGWRPGSRKPDHLPVKTAAD